MEGYSGIVQPQSNPDDDLDGRTTVYLAHLPLPYGTRVSQDGIPYRSAAGYDSGTFLGYPNRAGWPQALPSEVNPSFVRCEMSNPSDDRKLEDFLQTWLFFGLLHELLDDKFDESRYVARDARGITVHTRHLKEDINGWLSDVAHLTRDEGQKIYFHFQRCFSLADSALYVTASSCHPGFDRAIRQSIALLCETIAQVVDNTLPKPEGCNIPMGWASVYNDTQVLSAMERSNWCHSEARLVDHRSSSSSSIYFMERMIKPNLGRHHTTCAQDQCNYLTTDEKTYRTRHVDDDCNCQQISINFESLASILDSGHLPVLHLELRDNSSLNIRVESTNHGKAYVALSHVWADGLGNKNGNSLPTCQLRRLAILLQRLQGRRPWNRDEPEHRELLLWCDTLCVPVESPVNTEQNRLRNLAMQRMRDVYQQSSYVLVLDRTFEPYNIREIGLTEAAFRIITSPWAQRLWTYQEAALPKNLLFQFADTVVDIREIWGYHLDLGKREILLSGIVLNIVMWCASLRQPFHAEEGRTLGFNTVTSLLQGRHVSVATDEALCLATIFDLDVSRIQGNREERMAEFWRAMSETPSGIPRSMVLNVFPRIQKPGYRWAPSTLLDTSAIAHSLWIKESKGSLGCLNEAGLSVDLAAFRVHRTNCTVNTVPDQRQSRLDVSDTTQLRDVEGTWYNLDFHTVHQDTSLEAVFEMMAVGTDKMIVLVRNQIGSEDKNIRQQPGLLTKVTEDSSGNLVLRSMATIVLTSMTDGEQIPWTIAHALATYLCDSGSLTQAQPQTQHQSDSNQNSSQQQTQAYTPGELLSQITRYTSVLLDSDPALVQLIQNDGQRHPPVFLAIVTQRIILGQYLTVSEKFETNRTWCVD